MTFGDWNFLAGRITGDGTIDIVESDLPLDIGSTSRRLSAPSMMTGSITNEVKRLKVKGRPIFEPWNTVIIAEADGLIRGMTIYRKPTFKGSTWEMDQIGLPGYAIGMIYDGAKYFVDEDPLNIYRHIWTHLQSQKNGNLGLTVDALTSPVRVGRKLEQVQFDAETSPGVRETVAFEAGPRKLAWYLTSDLGKEIDDLAKETPFDWAETFSWQGDQPHCHIRLGYPELGGRKDHLRFVLGENLATEPDVTEGDYVNQAYVLGAGEGPARVRGYAGVTDGRLRRTRTVDDSSKRSVAQANALASATLAASRGEYVVETIEVYDHPNAPLEAVELGDTIPLYAEMDWAIVDTYARIIGKTQAPGKSDRATFEIARPSGAVLA